MTKQILVKPFYGEYDRQCFFIELGVSLLHGRVYEKYMQQVPLCHIPGHGLFAVIYQVHFPPRVRHMAPDEHCKNGTNNQAPRVVWLEYSFSSLRSSRNRALCFCSTSSREWVRVLWIAKLYQSSLRMANQSCLSQLEPHPCTTTKGTTTYLTWPRVSQGPLAFLVNMYGGDR